ncbi:MAG TPA: hypothetical protein VGE26_10705 [Sphingobacteriaceae bacterium]
MKKIFFLVIAILCSFRSFSQSPSVVSFERQIAISTVLDLTKSSNGTLYTFSTVANFDNGIVRDFDIIVKSNKPWNLTVTASSAQFTSGSPTLMPVSVINIKRSTESNYSTAPYVISGSRGKYTYTFNMRANPGYNYEPGTYGNVDINFVLEPQSP